MTEVMQGEGLGPLPERFDVVSRQSDGGWVHGVHVWCADDMRAYAAQQVAAERELWTKAVMDVVAAVDADGWCQECSLENVRPAVAALLGLLGPNAP